MRFRFLLINSTLRPSLLRSLHYITTKDGISISSYYKVSVTKKKNLDTQIKDIGQFFVLQNRTSKSKSNIRESKNIHTLYYECKSSI